MYLPPKTLIKIQQIGEESDTWFGQQVAKLVMDILQKR